MPTNPFKKRSKAEKAKERAELAVSSLREAAVSVRDQADSLITDLAPPVPEKTRRPLAAGALVGAAAAVAYGARKLVSGDDSSDLPSPDVKPTAPSGPTDPALNDPALKAKVESELFRDSEVPKDKVLIDVADGVVTLRGELPDAGSAAALAEAAKTIDGVRAVDNLLSTAEAGTNGNGGEPKAKKKS
jgi:hypothetical protein